MKFSPTHITASDPRFLLSPLFGICTKKWAPAVLGACLREFLFSEAFIGLGLDAAVVVSVCCTGEDAMIRDPDPKNSGALKKATGAILCRAAPSFLRFGSFELPARRGEVEVVRQLADFCLRFLRPCLDPRLDVPGRISSPAADPSRNQKECTSLMRGQETSQHGEERGRRKHDQFDKDTAGSRTDYLELLVAIVQASMENTQTCCIPRT